MDVTATLQRPDIQAIVNKITSVPSSTNYCLAFWVNTNISESVSIRPRPTPPPDHDDMATFQAPLVIASAPQQVLCQENQPSSEAQPGPDPAPRPLSSAIAEIFKVTIHLKDPQGNVETFAGGDKEVVFVNQLDNGNIAAPREPTPSQHEHQCPLHQLDTPPTTQLDLANTKLIVFDTIINGRTATTLFDPGSEFDLVKPHLADPAVPLRPIAQQPAQADSSPLAVLGITRARFALGPINTDYDFYVSPAIFYDAIAGKGWARHFACTRCWTCDKHLVRLHGARVLLQRAPEPPPPGQQQVHTLQQRAAPPPACSPAPPAPPGSAALQLGVSSESPRADPQPRSSAPPGSAALQLGVSSESPRAAPPPPSPRPPTLTLTTAEHVTITRGETRLVKFVCSSPITAPSLIAVDNEIQDGLQPVECLVGPSSDRVPVVNLSDADVELEPGRLLGRIPPENFNITIPTVTRVTARNKLPARPAPESVSNVNSTPVVEFDVNPALPAEQQEQLRQLLSDFEDIFHRPGEPIACTNILEAELQLHDQTLYYIPQYKLTPQQLKAAEEEVASLLQLGTETPVGERQRYRVVLDARPVNRRLKELNFRALLKAYGEFHPYGEIHRKLLRVRNTVSNLPRDPPASQLASILLQQDPSTRLWHPVANQSRVLVNAERNYSMTAIELLAVTDACSVFQKELQSLTAPCEVLTDCQALIYLHTAEFLPAVVARLMVLVRQHNLKFRHVPGSTNLAPDALSRNPLPLGQQELDVVPLPGEDVKTRVEPRSTVAAVTTRARAAAASATSAPQQASAPGPAPPLADDAASDSDASETSVASAVSEADAHPDLITENLDSCKLAAEQYADPHWRNIIDYRRLHPGAAPAKYSSYLFNDGLLYKETSNRLLFCVPAPRRLEVAQREHEFGHFALAKTKSRVASRYSWPSLADDCDTVVSNCTVCSKFKRKYQKEGLLQSIVPAAPNDIVHVDFKSAPKSRRGNQHIFVYVDAFTRYCRLYPTRDCTSRAARRAVLQAFGDAGVPNTLVCDAGAAFVDITFKKMLQDHGCAQHTVPAYAHHANGLAESLCKIVGDRVALMCNEDLRTWDDNLPKMQLAINTSHSKSLGNTPFFLQYGYHPNDSASLMPEISKPTATPEGRLPDLQEARGDAQSSLQHAHRQQAAQYNKGRRTPDYRPGQPVMIWLEPKTTADTPAKYALAWREATIKEQVNAVTYVVTTQQAGKTCDKHVHVNHIKKRGK
ncbi:Pro-Pol polyprotein [Frankliniella fusca]|uniref:RNA-directed DNA polymerase n=1 Tax=Frankliniella fusca TaxID=407009 RepID=A0AAE1GRG2_9NEOP|nr:Pro-Pol polyprotein [Frankliniella fusca]